MMGDVQIHSFIYASEIARTELKPDRQASKSTLHKCLQACRLLWSDGLEVQNFFQCTFWKHLWILVFKDVKIHFHLNGFTFQVLEKHLKSLISFSV